MRLAREASRGEAGRKLVNGSANCGSLSISASEKSWQGEEVGRSGSRRDLPYGELRGDGSERSGCREPDFDVSFARRTESSLDSASSRRVQGRVIYSEKNFSVAVIELTSL